MVKEQIKEKLWTKTVKDNEVTGKTNSSEWTDLTYQDTQYNVLISVSNYNIVFIKMFD